MLSVYMAVRVRPFLRLLLDEGMRTLDSDIARVKREGFPASRHAIGTLPEKAGS